MPKSKQLVLIRAVGYLRKSTKGIRLDGKGKQEKSISQQKAEIQKLATDQYEIVDWFEDDGISGSKRGMQRPGFNAMLKGVSKLKAQAILCDNLDRFSRAAVDEVQEDASTLRKADVRFIVTASHGTYDLGDRYSIGEILKFVVAVWSACEYSRQLSRRVTLARRNAATEGRRTGGGAAFGLANDGRGGLKHGDPKQIKVVRWMFEAFANRMWSMNHIAGDLNARKIPSPRGKRWTCKAIAGMLRNRAYRGDFVYNRTRNGLYYTVDDKGEVVETEKVAGPRKLFECNGCYRPLIRPTLFDKAQRRLAVLTHSRSRRRQSYALSGVLVCDHCGCPLFGSKPKGRRHITYKCSGNTSHGRGWCRSYTIRESDILPVVMRLLGEEIKHIEKLLTTPPDELSEPHKARRAERQRVEQERGELASQIAKAEENLLFSDDARTRKSLDARVTAMRDELERLDAELSVEPATNGYTKADVAALARWWEEFTKKAVGVPIKGNVHPMASFWQDSFCEEQAILLDPAVIRETMHGLGCEIRLRWKSEKVRLPSGTTQNHHTLARGRFRLGQRKGKLPIFTVTSGPPESPPRAWPEMTSQSSGPWGASTERR